jgi:hypothetical protein
MGAKDWMLMYADGDVRRILRRAPAIDREATRALVERLYPAHSVAAIGDGNLSENASPGEAEVYAGCLPGLTVLCTDDAALDRPSLLDRRFLIEGKGRTVYLHAMHSVVDWFAYAVWNPDGELRRSLSLAPDSGITESRGYPLAFEAGYWAGDRPVRIDDDEELYPLPFQPLELAEDALRTLFGFNYEGVHRDDDPDLFNVVLAGFRLTPA